MSKKNKQENQIEPEERPEEPEEKAESEPKRIPAVIKGVSFEALVVDGRPICEHCMQAVPKSALIDTEKLKRIEERERKIALKDQEHFREMVRMANKERKRKGQPPISEEEVKRFEEQRLALFG